MTAGPSENQLRRKIADAQDYRLGGPRALKLDADEVYMLANMLAFDYRKRLPHYGMEQFVEHAWPKIFSKVLEPEKQRRWSFSARFGETTLRIYELAARVLVTFVRDGGGGDVSYVTHDKDAFGDNFGLMSYRGHHDDHRRAFDDVVVSARYYAQFTEQFKYDSKQGIA